MNPRPSRKTLQMPQATHRALKRLSKATRRGMTAQVMWMVEEGCHKAGIPARVDADDAAEYLFAWVEHLDNPDHVSRPEGPNPAFVVRIWEQLKRLRDGEDPREQLLSLLEMMEK